MLVEVYGYEGAKGCISCLICTFVQKTAAVPLSRYFRVMLSVSLLVESVLE
mgnify:CR=1 FL=1